MSNVNKRAATCRFFAAILLGFAFVYAADGQEVERRSLRLSEPKSAFWNETSAQSPVQIPAGEALIAGQISDPAFTLPSVDNMRLLDANGSEVRLNIEESSLFREFGDIVTCLVYFHVPAESVRKGGESFVLEWGGGIQGDNQLVSTFRLPEQSDRVYREFELVRMSRGEKSSDDVSVTTLEVIADSNAKYYSLWYLLPITLIFILLTVRKVAIRNESEY